MSKISVNNLSFSYYGNEEKVFENVTFNIDTNWKLGLIGRNGKGKTTFLNLLLDKYEYQGTISKSIDLDYFPFDIDNKNKMAIEIKVNPHNIVGKGSAIMLHCNKDEYTYGCVGISRENMIKLLGMIDSNTKIKIEG